MYDYHVHSSYSDGEFLDRMLGAAADAGLDGVGFADHCNVSERDHLRRYKKRFGFNLDVTYERRREAIAALREEYDLRIFDAVEVDYHPADEPAIRAFLDDADFDYTVGSVHEVRTYNVHEGYFAELSAAERREAVDEYFERLVALVESDLFDVAAHLDIVERNPALRGHATRDHYEAVAAALAEAETVPEVNAGRIDREYAEFHPAPEFLDVLADHGVAVTVGSDSHDPEALRERIPLLRDRLSDAAVDVADLSV
ncbi:PHP domain-containing protein [Halosimplex salinum]|uniref:PHP domain-containing protein n=1 Tax=Halosimplex salinum TaxID=1710538 RepID=UPI000F46B733|nr:PHP domain-containing protein [Halosimplex salinum]